jgi:hypothetical protein
MNTTSLRIAKYAGAGIAGLATSVVLAAPALAMRPDPIPESGQTQRIYESQIIADAAHANDRKGQAAAVASRIGDSTSGGTDWSSVATGLGGGAVLGGAVVLGAAQARRRRNPELA